MDEQYAMADTEPYNPLVEGKTLRQASITESLEYKKKHLEDNLKRVNDALEALKKNPEIERIMNLVKLAV